MIMTITNEKVLLTICGGKFYNRIIGMLAIDYEKIWSEPLCNKSAYKYCFGACALNIVASLNADAETITSGYVTDCQRDCVKIYFASLTLDICKPFLDPEFRRTALDGGLGLFDDIEAALNNIA